MISPSDSALHRAASGTQEDGDEAGARSEVRSFSFFTISR